MKRKIGLTFLLCLLGMTLAMAQGSEQKPLRLGIGLLGASYVGDLNTGDDPVVRFHPGVSISLQFAGDKLLSPQLNTGFSRFVGQDRSLDRVEGVTPNTFVETPFFFVDIRLKARFFRQKNINPYVSAGLGLLGYTPKDQDGNNLLDNIATRNDGETYGSLTAGIPLSVGSEFHLSHIVALGVEYTYRLTATDYLDNISELGPRDGNDKLHSLLVSCYFTFDPNRGLNYNGIRGKDRR